MVGDSDKRTFMTFLFSKYGALQATLHKTVPFQCAAVPGGVLSR